MTDEDDIFDDIQAMIDACDHDDYEADILTGRAICGACGQSWYQTKGEIERERARQVAYDEQCAAWDAERGSND